MSSESTPPQKVCLKLLIDKERHKVVFAETGKEFVDFLFTILTFPIFNATKVCNLGCLSNIYGSIDALGDKYMLPNVNKDTLMASKEYFAVLNKLRLLFSNQPHDLRPLTPSKAKKFYVCSNYKMERHRPMVTEDPNTVCPICRTTMFTAAAYVVPPEETSLTIWADGYVRGGIASYTIMDDLKIQPQSFFKNLSLLKRHIDVTSGFDNLEEKVVHVELDQVEKWLKASTESKSVLTDIFLGNRAIA